ncbi:2-dehydro-3-deoxygalactonokinase [Serratia liquefaciens]|uniref:2-dehydro-3-deoxygalactonokinase n=1 Tax=Serratia liquefaciens TaxID=614 RepID=UPI0021572981|nr:2-dehydro-3-deoxygalactonokinase [Serratia liquefaciens]CAI1867787.1 2-keto-3-deoxy-galactonokinase [Serratia liquefaciens]
MNNNWIGIDWGTTNFRAFLMCGEQCLSNLSHPCGLLAVEKNRFADTLHTLLQPWLVEHGALPVVMAGMVGSQQGWHEVAYITQPCGLKNLAAGAMKFTTDWGSPAWIIPGVQGLGLAQQPEVMRGEEVQLLGLARRHPAAQCLAILPGTHSKHVQLNQGEIGHFSTFMTGELFSLLSWHSILGNALPEQQEDAQAFILGADTARSGAPLSHLIFSARTRRLSGEIAAENIHSYLSGLLIGNELQALPAHQPIWVVASPPLVARYQMAAEPLGLSLRATDGDSCFINGLSQLYPLLQGTAQ